MKKLAERERLSNIPQKITPSLLYLFLSIRLQSIVTRLKPAHRNLTKIELTEKRLSELKRNFDISQEILLERESIEQSRKLLFN